MLYLALCVLVICVGWRASGRLALLSQVVFALLAAELTLQALWAAGWRPGVAATAPSSGWQRFYILPSGRNAGVTEDFFPGPTRAPRVPGERPRVAFLGDSFTFGDGVSHADRFAHVAVEPGAEAQVLAAQGLNAYDVSALVHEIAALYVPDVVVWVFLPNDLGGGLADGEEDAWYDFVNDYGLRHRPPSVLAFVAGRALMTARRNERTVQSYRARALDPTNLSRLGERVATARSLLDARGARLVFVIFPFMHSLDDYPLADVHDAVAAVAAEAGAEVIDLLPAFRGLHAKDLWVSTDDHHPNVEGHRIAGEALRRALGRIERAGPVGACRAHVAPHDALQPELPERRLALCRSPDDPLAWLRWAEAWAEVRGRGDDTPSHSLFTATGAGMVEMLGGAPGVEERLRALWQLVDPHLDAAP